MNTIAAAGAVCSRIMTMAAASTLASSSRERSAAGREGLRRALQTIAQSIPSPALSGGRFLGHSGAGLAFGIPAIDAALGGGLTGGALHEIAAAREPATVAASGFVLALAAQTSRR